MKKKLLALLVSAAMICSFAGCGSSSDGAADSASVASGNDASENDASENDGTPTDTAPAETTPTETDGDTYTIGICQLVQHDALDAATQGFKDALVEELGEDKVHFDEQNAQGDSNTCSTIVNSFVSGDVDLILANATPALQAASAGTNEIPILGTSVTEYGVALDLDNFNGTVGGNISGTSDLAPLDGQADMLQEIFPDAKTVGLLY